MVLGKICTKALCQRAHESQIPVAIIYISRFTTTINIKLIDVRVFKLSCVTRNAIVPLSAITDLLLLCILSSFDRFNTKPKI